jgi:hypothetical protein
MPEVIFFGFGPFPDGGDHHHSLGGEAVDFGGEVFGGLAGAEQHALAQGGVLECQSHAHVSLRRGDAVDGSQVFGPDRCRMLPVVRVAAYPILDVGTDGDDREPGGYGVVQGMLSQDRGEAFAGVGVADFGVVENPFPASLVAGGHVLGLADCGFPIEEFVAVVGGVVPDGDGFLGFHGDSFDRSGAADRLEDSALGAWLLAQEDIAAHENYQNNS